MSKFFNLHRDELDIQLEINNYLKWLSIYRTASPHTLRAYGRELSLCFDQSGLVPAEELMQKVNTYLSRPSKLNAASKGRRVASIKSFLRYLFDQERIPADLRHRIRGPRANKTLPHFISVDEVQSILQHLKNAPPSQNVEHQRLLFLLLYGCGLRISEACNLRYSNFQSRQIRVIGKGQRERIVIIPDAIMKSLYASFAGIVDQHDASIWGERALPTRSGYELIRSLGKTAGLLRPLHPHALRHSYATHLLASGADLRNIQELLGHSSLRATERYTHLNIDQLARTLETCHPLSRRKISL